MNFALPWNDTRARLFIAILLANCLLTGCGGSARQGGEANKAAKPAEQVVTVTQAKAESRQVPFFIQATGSLVADESSDIAPKVAGKVVNVTANVGEFVRQGEVIAKIDDQDARLRLAQSKAAVAQAVAAVRQAEARLGLDPKGRFDASVIPEVRVARSNYNQAVAELKQAEANEKRYRELAETGDVAMVTYETFRTTRDTARTKADAARQQMEVTVNSARQNNQAIKSAEAAVDAAKTQLATSEQAIADTVVKAPFAGYLSNRPVAVGEYVTSASVIATVLRTNPIKAQIRIAEADVPFVGIGRGISISVDAYKDRNFAGTVTAINPSVDVNSRSAIIEAQIENGDNALRAGMFATAKINRDGGNPGVFVPSAAVLNDQSTQSFRVFVIQEGVAKLRTVQLGTEENGSFQILSGVNADEIVATSNLQQLYEGAKVQIQ